MPRAFLAFFLLLTLLLAAPNAARATGRNAPAAPQDTIVVRLPNQAVLTLTVRDAAQLRQLKNYHLDSLTSRLASYIAQAEMAAKNAPTDQVTLQFYPDKDQPGQNLPEQIRITTRKKTANTNRVDVLLNKTFGVVVTTDQNGARSYNTVDADTKEKRQARRDSTRRRSSETSGNKTFVVLDLGLNALTNQRITGLTGQTGPANLRTLGSRYLNIGLNYQVRLGGKHSPLHLLTGPEFSFNNFMLNGNEKWVNAGGQTRVVHEMDPARQYTKTKLATSSVNLPLMLRLRLHDSHYHSTFSIAAGGFVGYRLLTWNKLKYTSEGDIKKDKNYDAYNLENLQYGLQGTIGYRHLTLFARYHLNGLFKTGAGPDTQVLSFGLRLLGS